MCLFTLCQKFSKFDNQIEVAISPIFIWKGHSQRSWMSGKGLSKVSLKKLLRMSWIQALLVLFDLENSWAVGITILLEDAARSEQVYYIVTNFKCKLLSIL